MIKLLFINMIFLVFTHSFASECGNFSLQKTFIPQYAKHFRIDYFKDFKIITVDEKRYLLASNKFNIKCNQNFNVVTPVTRIVLTSTTFLPALNILNRESSLVGFQEKKYISSRKFNLNEIVDLPFELKMEEIIKIHPDIIMANDEKLSQNKFEKLYNDLNIAIVINKDSSEDSPLGRAEWIVYISSFFNQEDKAISEFNKIRDNYNNLKDKIRISQMKKPSVLLGEIQNGKWVYAGAKSDLGRLVQDAGGELILNVNTNITQQISLEELIVKKIQPDVWLPNNLWNSLEDLRKNMKYKFFESKKIYNNNLKLNPSGANDFWELGMQRPDLMLSDLYTIFYDKNIPLNWYKKLK